MIINVLIKSLEMLKFRKIWYFRTLESHIIPETLKFEARSS